MAVNDGQPGRRMALAAANALGSSLARRVDTVDHTQVSSHSRRVRSTRTWNGSASPHPVPQGLLVHGRGYVLQPETSQLPTEPDVDLHVARPRRQLRYAPWAVLGVISAGGAVGALAR
jgi:hypothetical protein